MDTNSTDSKNDLSLPPISKTPRHIQSINFNSSQGFKDKGTQSGKHPRRMINSINFGSCMSTKSSRNSTLSSKTEIDSNKFRRQIISDRLKADRPKRS